MVLSMDSSPRAVGQTVEALIVSWDEVIEAGSNPVVDLIEQLHSRGVALALWSDYPPQEPMRRLGPPGNPLRLAVERDSRLSEFGGDAPALLWESTPDPTRAGRALLDRLDAEGIGPGLIVTVGTKLPHLDERILRWDVDPGLATRLREQIDRRRLRRVPETTRDSGWVIEFEPGTSPLRVRETLCALANGHIGTRGSPEDEPPGSDPMVVSIGVYDDRRPPGLLEGPGWTHLPFQTTEAHREWWTLDLRNGLLAGERETPDGPVRSLRFVSLTHPGCCVLRAEAPEGLLADVPSGETRASRFSSRGGMVMSMADLPATQEGLVTVERIAAYVSQPGRQPDKEAADADLSDLSSLGSDRLLAEHRRAWAARWRNADIAIEGDPDAELALRLALFHLMSSAPTEGEAAIGARGLTGRAYRGHVFWDTDVFVLPALAATLPGAARAVLEYRIRRLPAAREEARRRHTGGARFPWESADEGNDVTPPSWTDPEGGEIPILTGAHEEHIVADVAWAARHYARWTGDDAVLAGAGRELLLDTARFWASRVAIDADGDGHIREVIGPDEYHALVDDNAYTNVMARANLRWAAGLAGVQGGADPEEIATWSKMADALVDGYDRQTRIYEQFAGYSRLEPLLVESLAPPPIAADLVLGPDRVAETQIIKQADVLMLHHLVPDQVDEGSLGPNLDYYLPRTAHGSSLSPPVHASLLARAGHPAKALEWFRLTARLDLDDLTGTTAGGIHLATMGGLWQAFTFGFLGVEVDDTGISVDPHLPDEWASVTQNLLARGSGIRLTVSHEEVEIESERPLVFRCGTAGSDSPSTSARFARTDTTWRKVQ